MIKKIIATVGIVAVIAAGAAAALQVTRGKGNVGSDTLKVSASFYPLYDFAKHVGGDKVSVSTITPAGAEPHDYEPSPQTLAQAYESSVFIYNGGSFEPWADNFLVDFDGTAIRASQGVALLEADSSHDDGHDHDHLHESVDPHFWLDPVIAQQVVNSIRDGLSKADPEHKEYYAANAERYNKQLARLDQRFADGLLHCTLDTAISSHGAFSYLAHRYSFTVISIAGIEPDDEPSPAKMAELTSIVKQKGIRYIFFESLVSPRLAETIAREAGVQTLVFDPIEGLSQTDQNKGKDYISIQYDNLENLRKALGCN